MDHRTRFLGLDMSTARWAVPMAGSGREPARPGDDFAHTGGRVSVDTPTGRAGVVAGLLTNLCIKAAGGGVSTARSGSGRGDPAERPPGVDAGGISCFSPLNGATPRKR